MSNKTLPPIGTPEAAAPFSEEAAERALGFARSELFDRTFKDGMALVEETAAYLDGPGRAASKRLPRAVALAYAGESMRLTTRLMQVASWLLVQKAVREGEVAFAEASSEKCRLIARAAQPTTPFAGSEELPEALRSLMARGAAIFERVRRLDENMYGEPEEAEQDGVSVNEQFARLQAAFNRG